MKKIIIPIGALFFSSITYAQLSPTENYVYSKTFLDYNGNTPTKSTETVQYFDGLGRSKQVINIKASPLGRDVVTPVVYDELGRKTRDYLPIPQQSTTNGSIYTQLPGLTPYPVTDPSNIYNGDKIFTDVQLENSPLDRIVSQKQVGNAWNDKPIQFSYGTNMDGEIKKYVATYNYTTFQSLITVSLPYAAGQLYKNTVTDEDGNKTIEFRNGKGQVVLIRKMLNATDRADTYYVYNNYDQLAYVLSPKAVDLIKNLGTDAVIPDTILNSLCYQYKYDNRNRLVEKKLPGKGKEFMVYDKADRLVATQDANMNSNHKWFFYKYDKFGRVIYTGIAIDNGDRNAVQDGINNVYGINTEVAGSYTQSGLQIPYGNTAYPQNIESILTVNFYDTYPTGTPTFTPTIPNQSSVLADTMSSELNTKSLALASYVKNIEDDNWTKNYGYYDMRGRVIGTHSVNHLGGYTQTESKLDFAGVPQQIKTRHKRLSSDTERMITETFEYDTQNRLKVHKHKIDNNPQEEILSQNDYNELSQLTTKNVGGTTLGSGLQEVNYEYNIRGWMTQINNPTSLGNDLFGYKINYNLVEGMETPHSDYLDLKVKPKFNGSIAEVSWRTATTPNDNLRRYGYVYDGLNRLQAGFYQKDVNPSAQEYFEKIDYDLNGNISHLKRSGALTENYVIANAFDDLTYHYQDNDNSNRLHTVTDASNNYGGYPEVQGTAIGYDLNGNMTSHEDKGILEFKYNHLNLLEKIIFNSTYMIRNYATGEDEIRNVTVAHIYGADGTKRKKKYTYFFPKNSTERTTTTDYLDGFQYTVNYAGTVSLDLIPTSEGYFDFKNNWYIYNYMDHLGNVRLSYRKDYLGNAYSVDENNYYPFGLRHEGYNNPGGNASYQYKYNGKELQLESGMYDYGARMYMPDLGRWGVQDPNQESYTNQSSYNYVGNNPIMRMDQDGRDWYYTSDGQYLYNKDLNRDNADQFFKDNNIEGAQYAFASNTMGTMNYAADGYIYDDSAAGGGKPIENGRLNTIEGVTIAKTNWWNSSLARFLVPDRFGVTTSTSAGAGVEVGATMGFEVITRGKDAGIYFDPGNTFSAGILLGASGEVDYNFFTSRFSGKVSDMDLNSVVGTEAYVKASVLEGVGINGGAAVSFDPKAPLSGDRWFTTFGGVSVGGSPTVVSGGAGVTVSNTRIGIGFDGKVRVADYSGAMKLNKL